MTNSLDSSIDSRFSVCVHSASQVRGAVAQLGERLNGIQEVEGSIPFGSTNLTSSPSCPTRRFRHPSVGVTERDDKAPRSDHASELLGAFSGFGPNPTRSSLETLE